MQKFFCKFFYAQICSQSALPPGTLGLWQTLSPPLGCTSEDQSGALFIMDLQGVWRGCWRWRRCPWMTFGGPAVCPLKRCVYLLTANACASKHTASFLTAVLLFLVFLFQMPCVLNRRMMSSNQRFSFPSTCTQLIWLKTDFWGHPWEVVSQCPVSGCLPASKHNQPLQGDKADGGVTQEVSQRVEINKVQ